MVDEYICVNFLYFIVFNDDALKNTLSGRYDGMVLKDYFLEAIRALATFMNEQHYLDDRIKGNLSELVNYIRHNGNKNLNSQINEVIRLLNSGDGTNVMEFYRNQIESHYMLEKRRLIVDPSDIWTLMGTLSNNTFFLAATHTIYGDEEFEREVPEMIEDEDYFDTIMHIFMTQEGLLENPNFIRRVKHVMDLKKDKIGKIEKQKMKTFDKIINTIQ